MHVFFAQSCLVSVYTHLTGASTNCVDGAVGGITTLRISFSFH